jgi:hypothetical protein
MISGIKIYKPDGSLKKEISKEKALKLYDEQNKTNWSLSPAEKKWWKNFRQEDVVKENRTGNGRGGIGLRYRDYKKRTKLYKHKCEICNSAFKNLSTEGKFCSQKCRLVKRKIHNKVNYHKRKNSFD